MKVHFITLNTICNQKICYAKCKHELGLSVVCIFCYLIVKKIKKNMQKCQMKMFSTFEYVNVETNIICNIT